MKLEGKATNAFVDAQRAANQLSRLLDQLAGGEEIIITSEGKPVARLLGCHGEERMRTGGHWKGLVRISDDFDEPLPKSAE